jgi:hypothetical protein
MASAPWVRIASSVLSARNLLIGIHRSRTGALELKALCTWVLRALGTHRFQRALGKKPIDRNPSLPNRRSRTEGAVYLGLVPINSSFAETARWKRCVPRGHSHSAAKTRRISWIFSAMKCRC